MVSLHETLSKIYSILNKNIVILSRAERLMFPKDCDFKIHFSELIENVDMNYLGYNIYKIRKQKDTIYVCIQAEKYTLDQTTQLILYMVETSLNKCSTSSELLIDMLEGNISNQDSLRLQEEFSNWLNRYLLLIEYSSDQKEEINEIIIHSIDTQFILDYKDYFLVISNDNSIEEACNNLAENILSDLYVECTIAIGGKIDSFEDLKKIYSNCLQSFSLKKSYNLPDYVMNYEKMVIYRIISDMNKEIKQDILNSVFKLDTDHIIDEEIELTIDALFKNNLNLTDTAKNIFIHRNTLLYRIEKFQKQTGLDLKKFEDNWLLKLAWLIRQEMKNK